jgi:hypothetical protein
MMRNAILDFRKLLGVLALGVFAVLSDAATIMVYAHSQDPVPQEARLAAASLLERWISAESLPESDFLSSGFQYRVWKGPTLTAEHSVGPGMSAYFLCDPECKLDGLGIQGQAAFAARGLSVEETEGEPAAVMSPFSPYTGLKRVLFVRGSLELTYTLAQPDLVQAEILNLEGRVMRKWRWRETAMGDHVRNLQLPKAQGGAPLFLRWRVGEVGNTRAIQRP